MNTENIPFKESSNEKRNFFQKLEDNVENILKISAYIILVGGVLASLICAIGSATIRNFYESSFSFFTFIFVLIGGIISSFFTWAVIMFCINIGTNIKRLRELKEQELVNKA